jgi:hypothetical protein
MGISCWEGVADTLTDPTTRYTAPSRARMMTAAGMMSRFFSMVSVDSVGMDRVQVKII